MSAQTSTRVRGTPVEVRRLHVASGTGAAKDFRSVRCPVHQRTLALQDCQSCADHGGVTQDRAVRVDSVSCLAARASAAHEAAAGPGDLRAVAARTPLSELMTTQVFAVHPDVSLEALTDLLLDHGIGGAPVVDAEGRPVGFVSRTDLLTHRFVSGDTGEALARGREVSRGHYRVELGPGVHVEALPYDAVGDVMTRAAFALPESATVTQAAALMAERGVHRVVVVSDDGRLAGLVTSSDVVRWVARRGPAREVRPGPPA